LFSLFLSSTFSHSLFLISPFLPCFLSSPTSFNLSLLFFFQWAVILSSLYVQPSSLLLRRATLPQCLADYVYEHCTPAEN
jgi:hypothetical protein